MTKKVKHAIPDNFWPIYDPLYINQRYV